MRIQDVPCVTVAQMREIDRLMIEEVGITLAQMMENAGRALGAMGRNAVRDVVRARVVAMAGPGGNGGGVLVAARRLAIWGAHVSVVLAATPNRMHEAAAHELTTLVRMGITIAGPDAPLPALDGTDLLLDGVFGYSLDGAPRGRAADLIRATQRYPAPRSAWS